MGVSVESVFYVGYYVDSHTNEHNSQEVNQRLNEFIDTEEPEEFVDYVDYIDDCDDLKFFIGFQPKISNLSKNEDGTYKRTPLTVEEFVKEIQDDSKIMKVKEAYKYFFGEDPKEEPYIDMIEWLSV